MVILIVSKCMNGIIPATNTRTGASGYCSAAPVKKSCLEQNFVTPCLCGADSRTPVGNKESIALFSGTNHITSQATLLDKLMPSLISSGLVEGITPTSVRTRSSQQMLDFVFSRPDGANAD